MPINSSRKGCKKIDSATKEKALALLATNVSAPRVAEMLKLKLGTVKTWEINALKKEKAIKNGEIDDDNEIKLNEVRQENKKKFVNNAWDLINESMEVAKKRIHRSNCLESNIDTIAKAIKDNSKKITEETGLDWFALLDVIKELQSLKNPKIAELSTLIGVIYDKQAIASNEPTDVVKVNLEDFAE